VNYDDENWRFLIKTLRETPTEINVLNRAQLIDDSFNLARAEKLHYSVPLRLSSYLKIEDDVLPWYSAINGYSYILERMRRNALEYSQIRVSKILYTFLLKYITFRVHYEISKNIKNEKQFELFTARKL